MRSSARTGRTGNARQPQEPVNKTIPLIGSIVAAVAVIILFVLYLVSFSGENRRNPIVLFSGADGNFPVVSMQNTLHRAGFDLQRFEDGELDPDRQYILVSLDDNAVSDMAAYRDSDNVLGFVLVCPTIPEEGLPSGFDSSEPSKDIAIFAGKDNSSEVVSMGAPRVIFERISGVDTVYGVPTARGGLFASRCFVSMAQNRYLSLSAFGADEGKELLYSPLFQNELAGYLSITYRDATIKDASFAGINIWFITAFIAIFACIFGLSVYLMLLPVVVSDIKQEKVPAREKIAVAAIGGITVAFAIGVVAMAFWERLRSYSSLILAFIPLVFMVILTISRFSFIVFDKTDYKSRSKMKRTAFMSVIIALSALFIMLILGDMDTYFSHTSAPLTAAVAFVPDLLCATCLLYADRKSRSMGEGGCSYFGNRVIFLLMLIPSVFAIIFGIIFRQHEITVAGFKGLYTTLVPFILLVPLRRHSDQSLIPGILHGILFAMSVLFVL